MLFLIVACAPISWSSENKQAGSNASNVADENDLAWPAIKFTNADGSASGDCLTKWLFEKGLTRLQVAAAYCDAKTVQWLLDRGFDIEELNNDEETALHVASRAGNTETVLSLIGNGAVIEALDHYERTPLHEASLFGNSDTVLALIDNGADVHARSYYGGTPLYFAAGRQGNAETIIALVENGADIATSEDNFGLTPLHNAAVVNPVVMPVLLELGADIEVMTDSGETPLEFAVRTYRIESVKFLLEQGADMSGALIYAAFTGNVEALQLLVEAVITRLKQLLG